MFHWILLKNRPISEKIVRNIKHIVEVDNNVANISDEVGLFDKFIHITSVSKTRTGEWDTKSFTAFEIFECVRSECISFKKRTCKSFWNTLLTSLILMQLQRIFYHKCSLDRR
jgi:hypothetical protein